MTATLRVQLPGLMTTVQDLGRPGYGRFGISASGAADAPSLKAGNRVLGNPATAPALEMTLLGGTFEFTAETRFALTGADMGATLEGKTVPLWRAVTARQGQTLTCSFASSGARSYLCVEGGFVVPEFLGSASTHVQSGLGGFEGRPLKAGDELKIAGLRGLKRNSFRAVKPELLARFRPRKTLRVTAGADYMLFKPEDRIKFLESEYKVTDQSNRLGLRLDGPRLPAQSELLSCGVSLGVVQITPEGLPAVLFVEQQTTGGYPQIVAVIRADHASIGQLRPGDTVTFERVDIDEALKIFKAQEAFFKTDFTMEVPAWGVGP